MCGPLAFWFVVNNSFGQRFLISNCDSRYTDVYIYNYNIYLCLYSMAIYARVALVEQLRAMQMLLINAQRQQINAI